MDMITYQYPDSHVRTANLCEKMGGTCEKKAIWRLIVCSHLTDNNMKW